MNIATQPGSTPRWVIAGRCVSSLFCAIVLAVAIPNLGSVSLPNHRIGYGWRDALSVGIMVAPLLVIFIGAICSRAVEYVGWSLALILLIWMFVAYQRFMAGPSPNKAHSANPAITSLFHAGHLWRGVADARRYA